MVAVPSHVLAALRRPRTPSPHVPPTHHPDAIEAAYAAELVAIIREIYADARGLLEALPRTDSADRPRPKRETIQRIGLRIVIENPAGSVREWIDSDGTKGSTVMRWPYGFIDDVIGADGEDVDVYIGPELEPAHVFVVHQAKKSSGFTEYDEDKVMLGFESADAAINAYLEQYDDPRFLRGMDVFTREDFIARLRAAGIETAPATIGRIAHVDAASSADVIRMRQRIERARRALTDPNRVRRLHLLAEKYARMTSARQREEIIRQAKAAFGVDVSVLDRETSWQMDAFILENVNRIESLGNGALDDVANIVAKAYSSDDSITVARARAADEIESRFGVSERKARMLARDQIGKLNGQVNRSRQQEMGLTRFKWITKEDDLVRKSHRRLHGRIFSWDDLPFNERGERIYPGSDINCRCGAQPVFDDVESVAGLPNRDRPFLGPERVNYQR